MKQLAIIIVNYNTKDILRDCLNHLTQLALPDTQIIVIDNGSQDGSAEMVEAEFKNVDLVKTENNGVAAGFNLGLTRVPDADYYLFMGTDAFPKPGCVDGVMDFMEAHSEVGVASAKLVLRDGSLDNDAHRGFPTPWTALTHFVGLDNSYFLKSREMEEPHEIDLCISHFMLVKREVLLKVGRWDEDFFVYGEDVDFCWRVKQAGFKIYYLPQFECLHYKGVSVGTRKESADITRADLPTKSRMRAESVRAMRLFYQKHMYQKYPWILNKMVEAGISVISSLRK